MGRGAALDRPRPSRLRRRDMGQDQHDTHVRSQPAWCAAGGASALRTLGDDDLPGRDAFEWIHRTTVRGRRDQRPRLPGLGPTATGPLASGGRHCGNGQPLQPQVAGRGGSHRGGCALKSATCHPIRPISIRSNSPSASSRSCSVMAPSEQRRSFGISAAASSVCSPKTNVGTTSDTADTATVKGRPH